MNVTLRKIDIPADFPLRMAERAGMLTDLGAWDTTIDGREFSVIRSRELIARNDWRWHISVAGRDKEVPPWDVLVAIGHQIRPGVVFVIGVPPRSWWINVHSGTLHLYETKDHNLIEQWKAESRGDEPT